MHEYQPKHLTETEAQHVLEIIKTEDPFLGLACEILYRTGRRISELLYLTRRNIKKSLDLDEYLFYFPVAKIKKTKIRGSTRRMVEVPIPAEKYKEWENVLSIYGAPKNRVYFFSRRSWEREKDISIRKRYERLLKQLHYQDEIIRDLYLRKSLRFHVWRHSYAWMLFNTKKQDISELRQSLAHSDIKTTLDNYGNWYFDSHKRYLDF